MAGRCGEGEHKEDDVFIFIFAFPAAAAAVFTAKISRMHAAAIYDITFFFFSPAACASRADIAFQ